MNLQEGRDRFDAPKNFEIPKNVKDMTEAGLDQARNAFESFLGMAQKAATQLEQQGAAAQATAKELSNKAASIAETNVRASLDFAERLLAAKDMGEVLRLQSEHVRERMQALSEQASEMSKAVTRATIDATKPKQ